MDYIKYDNKKEYSRDLKVEKTKKIRATYKIENDRLYQLFKTDAIKEVGLEGHPKADKAFELAWQAGHSFGYEIVFGELENLADLIL